MQSALSTLFPSKLPNYSIRPLFANLFNSHFQTLPPPSCFVVVCEPRSFPPFLFSYSIILFLIWHLGQLPIARWCLTIKSPFLPPLIPFNGSQRESIGFPVCAIWRYSQLHYRSDLIYCTFERNDWSLSSRLPFVGAPPSSFVWWLKKRACSQLQFHSAMSSKMQRQPDTHR